MLANNLRRGGRITAIRSASFGDTGGANSTSLVINKPTSLSDGDLLVAFVAADGNVTWTNSTGFTEAFDSGSDFIMVAYKTAGGAEPASYTFTSSNTAASCGIMAAISAAAYDTIGAVSASANSPVAPAITMSASGLLLLAAWNVNASTTFTAPAGFTLVYADANANRPAMALFAKPVPAGSTGTVTITTSNPGSRAVLLGVKSA